MGNERRTRRGLHSHRRAPQAGIAPARGRGHERGFTMVEMAVAATLLVGVIGLTSGVIQSMQTIHKQSEADLAQTAHLWKILQELRDELRDATLENDPATNQPRWRVDVDGSGRQTLHFQKLEGARMVADEVQPQWSTDIAITALPDGRVVRTQDGQSRVLGSGVASIAFEATASGRFRIVCVTEQRDPRTGRVTQRTQDLHVRPTN